MLQAVAQSSVNAALLRGAKTQEAVRKAAGQNVRLIANSHDYGDIPPKMKVFALAELALEQVGSPFAMGHDEPVDRPPADPQKVAHGGGGQDAGGSRGEHAAGTRGGQNLRSLAKAGLKTGGT